MRASCPEEARRPTYSRGIPSAATSRGRMMVVLRARSRMRLWFLIISHNPSVFNHICRGIGTTGARMNYGASARAPRAAPRRWNGPPRIELRRKQIQNLPCGHAIQVVVEIELLQHGDEAAKVARARCRRR